MNFWKFCLLILSLNLLFVDLKHTFTLFVSRETIMLVYAFKYYKYSTYFVKMFHVKQIINNQL